MGPGVCLGPGDRHRGAGEPLKIQRDDGASRLGEPKRPHRRHERRGRCRPGRRAGARIRRSVRRTDVAERQGYLIVVAARRLLKGGAMWQGGWKQGAGAGDLRYLAGLIGRRRRCQRRHRTALAEESPAGPVEAPGRLGLDSPVALARPHHTPGGSAYGTNSLSTWLSSGKAGPQAIDLRKLWPHNLRRLSASWLHV